MNIVYYDIKDELIVRKLKEVINAKIGKAFWMETMILIEPQNAHFKNIVNELYNFFKEHKLDIEDFVYIYNFSGINESHWFCQILKKRGLKRMSSTFK